MDYKVTEEQFNKLALFCEEIPTKYGVQILQFISDIKALNKIELPFEKPVESPNINIEE